MLGQTLRAGVLSRGFVQRGLRTSSAACASDPVQELFLEKLKSYTAKSKAAGGAPVDVGPSHEKELSAEMDRIAKTFRIASQQEAATFPTFSFKDPQLDSIHLADIKK